tara:strand:- start:213 stop:602 length:390 start_codon:yes stop_codon:yes gene_type:complete
MAGIPLNTFKNINLPLTANNIVLYSTATGLTSIVLMAQATNINVNGAAQEVTFQYYRNTFNTGLTPGAEVPGNFAGNAIVIAQSAVIPPGDSLILLSGKLVLETFDFIAAQSDSIDVHFIGSVLETANQ